MIKLFRNLRLVWSTAEFKKDYDRESVMECAKRRPFWDECFFGYPIGISFPKMDATQLEC